MLNILRAVKRFLELWWYRSCVALLQPVNLLLSIALRNRLDQRSVLHVSAMVHVPYQTTRLIRKQGWKADYLAIGTSPIWDKSDYCRKPRRPIVDAFDEMLWVWGVVARYRVLHLHFMTTVTRSGWELPWLKRMGRAVVVHWRGCEIRNRERNMALHPDVNLCQGCDYNPRPCEMEVNVRRRELAKQHGDAFLVTTPDMLDFAPAALHLPFFRPEVAPPVRPGRADGTLRIVHVTVHPGLEGTEAIREAVENLQRKGRKIEFKAYSWITPDEVLKVLAEADVAIGKMKMGYYANAQIEGMAMGVPTITFVRPEFMTEELRRSGFIFCTLANLEHTLEHYLDHPEDLAAKRAIARDSIFKLHDNEAIAARLVGHYEALVRGVKPT